MPIKPSVQTKPISCHWINFNYDQVIFKTNTQIKLFLIVLPQMVLPFWLRPLKGLLRLVRVGII